MDSNQTTLTQKEFAKQEIIRINAQPATTRLEKQHKQQLLEHYQRILNTNPLSDQEIAKSEQGQLSVIYQGNQSFAD
jgi:TPP-dependent indolepyruvate ferredoxin oxidoreductase alpha subunit